MIQYRRIQETPVLAKGSTYDGWTADSIAAPSVCHDGTQFVMTVSLWSIANSEWASAFFTSPDLVTWSYVASSLRVPQGSDYILGNAGLVWWDNKYWFAYNHYQTTPNGVAIQTSTDLVNWTTVYDPMPGSGGYDADPSLSVNPGTGKLELWCLDVSRDTTLFDTSDGVTFTYRGVLHEAPSWNVTNYGEPDVYYRNGARILTFDTAYEGGRRSIGFSVSPAQNSTWTTKCTVLGPNLLASWESINVFDSANVGVYDRGDGRGAVCWMLYAGGDVVAATDNTSSGIGLAYLVPEATAYSASGPSSGSVGSQSAPFTVTATNGLFSGVETITITVTDGIVTATATGGTITNNGTAAVTVAPAIGEANFTFTRTAENIGTDDAVFTNGQGWSDIANMPYEATEAAASGGGLSGISGDSGISGF